MKRQSSYSSLFETELVEIPARSGSAPGDKCYVGIDNGVSGSIAIIKPDNQIVFQAMPTKHEPSYTKEKKMLQRIRFHDLIAIFKLHEITSYNSFVLIERPMVNPKRWVATTSALRALEATLIAVDDVLHLPFQYADSKKWQKELLPAGTKGDDLKTMSLAIGNRMFPKYADYNHPDRDSLLMAEYARRNKL